MPVAPVLTMVVATLRHFVLPEDMGPWTSNLAAHVQMRMCIVPSAL